jgi:hypothetical protein
MMTRSRFISKKVFLNFSSYLLFILTILLIAFMLFGCTDVQFRTPLFEAGKKSNYGPTGLAYDGRDFIMIGKGKMLFQITNVHLADYPGETSTTPTGDYSMAKDPFNPGRRGIEICGLAWEGACCGDGFLWAVDATNKELLKLNRDAEIVTVIPSPCQNPSGLAFDGVNLWVSDEITGKLYKVYPKDGKTLKIIDSPIQHPTGLAFANNILWVVGTTGLETASESYKVGLFGVDMSSGLPGKSFGTYKIKYIQRPSSLEWADNMLWIGDIEKNRIFKFKPPRYPKPFWKLF